MIIKQALVAEILLYLPGSYRSFSAVLMHSLEE